MRMISIPILCLLIITAAIACGGEKQEKPSALKEPPIQVQQGQSASDLVWETLPSLPEAISTRARMVPGNRGYKKFEIRIFLSQEDTRTIVDFYKKGMPEEWTFTKETKLEDGLQGEWEATSKKATLWIRVTKSTTEEGNEIEIIYGQRA